MRPAPANISCRVSGLQSRLQSPRIQPLHRHAMSCHRIAAKGKSLLCPCLHPPHILHVCLESYFSEPYENDGRTSEKPNQQPPRSSSPPTNQTKQGYLFAPSRLFRVGPNQIQTPRGKHARTQGREFLAHRKEREADVAVGRCTFLSTHSQLLSPPNQQTSSRPSLPETKTTTP